jgi:uncharacterized protein YndB with AHSA1/START domain
MNEPSTAPDRQLTIRRTIKAPRQRVFEAWTRTEHLQKWWRCNPAWSTEVAQVDLRVGGKYRLGMRDPQQERAFVCGGEFTEIRAPEKLVFTWSWEPPGMEVGQTLVTVEFFDRGDATELVLTHERFPNAAAAGEHTKGWSGCLDCLAALMEGR